MSNSEFGIITLQLFLLIALAQLLGYWFNKLRQPKVIGEILAGIVLGPSILGHFVPSIAIKIFPQIGSVNGTSHDTVLMFLYNLGLLLLMFASGAETRGLFQPRDRRQITWLALVGTGAPFVIALACSAWIPTQLLETSPKMRFPVLLIVSIAVAVTSIPVISKILHDLGILHTRFSRLVLGVAVIEDIALWAVLAIATAAAASSNLPELAILKHIAITIVYFATAMLLMPKLLRWMADQQWNILAQYSPVGYLVLVLLAYSALAAVMDVSLVFAAFLAGFGIACDGERYSESLDALKKLSFAVFIPVYFAVVGYKLDLSKSFSFSMLAIFMLVACVLKLLAAGTGARIAGFSWPSSVNLAVATNARGGPGIVLASVAFDAGIINAQFYTTLVLTAVLTSQFAGAWLDYVLRKGKPLLTEDAAVEVVPIAADEDVAA